MVFIYRVAVASGTAVGVEGTSAGMALISTFMQDCGWALVENRMSQPGSNIDADAPHYVFSSNGENENYPTYYITLTSGSHGGANQDVMFMSASSAFDTGTHTTAASGVSTRSITAVTDQNADLRLQIYSQSDDTELYMSGDSEMVHIVSRKVNNHNTSTTMDNVFFGRFNSFFPVEENPYPVVVMGVQGGQITTTTSISRGIGGNPPRSSAVRGDVNIRETNITQYDANQPYINGVDSIFTAVPMMVTYDALPVAGVLGGVDSIAGMVRNGWKTADRSSCANLSILTASGAGGAEEFITFTSETLITTPSLVLRKS